MSRCLIVAELATSFHGDVGLAEAMIAAAAEAGADYVKTQAYSLDALNPADAQAQWLRESHLDEAAHRRLMKCAEQYKIKYMSTPFDRDALGLLRRLRAWVKIASSEAQSDWWGGAAHVVSWPWGRVPIRVVPIADYNLAAIPLYPTPLECVEKAPLLDGLSDHTIGLTASLRAIALGAKMVEVHFTHAGARHMPFDKTAEDIRRLRDFAEDCCTISTGVSRQYRERWQGRTA